MATFALAGNAAYGSNNNAGLTVVEAIFDCSDIDGAGTTVTSGDIIQAINVPANTWVAMVRCEVVTVEGGAGTIDVGLTGVNAAGFFNDLDVNALTDSVSGPVSLTEAAPNTVTGYSAGTYITAADTIDILANANLDVAQIRLIVVMIDLNGKRKFDWGS